MAKKIFISTPSYVQPVPDYYVSLLASVPALERAGISVEWSNPRGCCYIHTARNKAARAFLMSECDEMLFVDSDIGWNADEIVELCKIDRDIVGGAAPFKFGSIGFPTHPKREDGFVLGDASAGLVLVDVLPTAMMKITREVFGQLAKRGKAAPRIEYNPDGSEHERYVSFFDFEADNKHMVEYGEDVTFCRKWQSIGGQVWCYPNMTLRHHPADAEPRHGNFDEFLRANPAA